MLHICTTNSGKLSGAALSPATTDSVCPGRELEPAAAQSQLAPPEHAACSLTSMELAHASCLLTSIKLARA